MRGEKFGKTKRPYVGPFFLQNLWRTFSVLPSEFKVNYYHQQGSKQLDAVPDNERHVVDRYAVEKPQCSYDNDG